MTITDVLAAYGALLATGLAVWDVAKYLLDRPKLRVRCYVAEMVDPNTGRKTPDLLAYSVANTGGKPMVVSAVGGVYKSGKHFMLMSEMVSLPRTLQPGESVTVPGPLPNDVREVTYFWVSDGLNKEWKVSTKTVFAQLDDRPKRVKA